MQYFDFTRTLVKVTQSCLTLCDPMDCRLPGCSVRGIPQARILEWVAVPFSKGSSWSRSLSSLADSLLSEPPTLVLNNKDRLFKWSSVRNPPTNVGDSGDPCSILGSGRSPGRGNGNTLQYSCLENSMDRGGIQSHGVPKSQTWLSTYMQ